MAAFLKVLTSQPGDTGLPATWFAVLQSSEPDMDCWRRSKSSSTWTKNHPQNLHFIKFHQQRKKVNLSHCQPWNRLTEYADSHLFWRAARRSVLFLPQLLQSLESLNTSTYLWPHFASPGQTNCGYSSPQQERFLELIFGTLSVLHFQCIALSTYELNCQVRLPPLPLQKKPSRNPASQTTSLLKKLISK